jgi:hypothetical protein
LFGKVDVGTVNLVVYGSARLLQGFPDALGPSIQLGVQLLLQMMVTGAILECSSNLFVRHPSRAAM